MMRLLFGRRGDVASRIRALRLPFGRRGEVASRIRALKLSFGRQREVASITIEHGVIKLLLCRGREVLGYRVLLANPRFFREGLVSNSGRIAGIIRSALPEMKEHLRRAIGAVPGFQNTLRVLEFPRTPGLDPRVVIPREASRMMGISLETSHLTWYRLPDRVDRSRWLVVTVARRSTIPFLDAVQKAGVKVTTLEPRPFALARAINQPDAVIAFTSLDGCDVVVVKEWVPVTYQNVFWGAELVAETVVVHRLTEVVGRTIAAHDATAPDGPLSEEVPLYVCGSLISRDPTIATQIAENLQRPAGELAPPLTYPDDFPVQDLIVNIGLTLREA